MSAEGLKVYSVKEVAKILQTSPKDDSERRTGCRQGRQGVEDTSRTIGGVFGKH